MRSTPIVVVAAFLAATIANPAHAEAPSSLTQPRSVNVERPEHPDLVLLRNQMRIHRQLPSIDFWLAVAQCETRQHWDRGINWRTTPVSGGLGIANTTWRGYGGLRFATKAAKASMWAQIYVANNIGFLGAQTTEYLTLADKLAHKPFYRPAAGFSQGWGGTCRKNWVKKHNGGKP